MSETQRPRLRPARRNRAQSVTDLRASVADDRRARAIKYSITMGVRTACVILLFFVHGWWIPIVLVGAIVLPYVAVVIANVGGRPQADGPTRPGAIVHAPAGPPVRPVVVDAESGFADPDGPTDSPRTAA